MNAITFSLSISSLVVVMATWITYLRTIPIMKVPVKPTGMIVLHYVGIGVGTLAMILNFRDGELFSLIVFVPALFAVMMGIAFLVFYAQRKTPIGDLKVNVGDKLLPFSATTSEGTAFDSSELAGKRILLKFFRGAW